jgi:peptidoglycan/LPS O-acetylase OafA/YrhL
MGLLRTLLALLVVCSHMLPIPDWPARMAIGGSVFAVKAFFIISGFYMALVLHKQYSGVSVKFFYASRLSRLLPLYWFVAILTLLVETIFVPRGQFFYPLASPLAYGAGLDLHALPWSIWAYISVSLATTLGLDTGQWLGFSKLTGAIGISPDYVPNATSVMGLSPVPPAWSIGIELLFYLVAPFVVQRSISTLVVLAAGSLAFRLTAAWFGLSGDPWNRTLFPSELIFFVLGVLAFRIHTRRPSLPPRCVSILQITPIVLVLFISPLLGFTQALGSASTTKLSEYAPGVPAILLTSGVTILQAVMNIVPYVLIAACIPSLFEKTKNSPIDSRIGDLSYPIYIGHMFVLGMMTLMVPASILRSAIGLGWLWLLFNLTCVIAVAFVLDRVVAAPIDRWRRRFGARARVEPTGGALTSTPPVPPAAELNVGEISGVGVCATPHAESNRARFPASRHRNGG